jgi:hypothetical protein
LITPIAKYSKHTALSVTSRILQYSHRLLCGWPGFDIQQGKLFFHCTMFRSMWEKRNACRILVERPGGKKVVRGPSYMWEDDVLKWSLKKQYGVMWTGLIWLGIETNEQSL